MKKKYIAPEFDLYKLKFDSIMQNGDFFSDPGNGAYTGTDPEGDPFA